MADPSSKVVDILADELQAALKAVDVAALLAFTAVAFLVIHGIQGDFRREADRQKAEHQQRQASPAGGSVNRSEPIVTEVVAVGLRAQLLTAALFAIALYWIFTLHAAFRTQRAWIIADRLGSCDNAILSAVLLTPSLATATARSKVLSCVALGGLAYAAFVVMYGQLPDWTQLEGRNRLRDHLLPASIMLVPAVYLCGQLLRGPKSPRLSGATS